MRAQQGKVESVREEELVLTTTLLLLARGAVRVIQDMSAPVPRVTLPPKSLLQVTWGTQEKMGPGIPCRCDKEPQLHSCLGSCVLYFNTNKPAPCQQ